MERSHARKSKNHSNIFPIRSWMFNVECSKFRLFKSCGLQPPNLTYRNFKTERRQPCRHLKSHQVSRSRPRSASGLVAFQKSCGPCPPSSRPGSGWFLFSTQPNNPLIHQSISPHASCSTFSETDSTISLTFSLYVAICGAPRCALRSSKLSHFSIIVTTSPSNF